MLKFWSEPAKELYNDLRNSESSAVRKIALAVKKSKSPTMKPLSVLVGLKELYEIEKSFDLPVGKYDLPNPTIQYGKRLGLDNFKWRGTVMRIENLKSF